MLKSGASTDGQWRDINGLGRGHFFRGSQLDGQALHPSASTNGRMRRMFANEPQHPFRIYQLPAWYRTTPDPTTDWLKFCVRGGSAFIGGAEVVVTGTDGELFPCDETFPLAAGAGVNEVTLTAGTAQWWFWIEVSAGAAAINHGSAAPTWDLGHIPVGFVDTATYAAQKICHVRQYQMTDVWPILACPAV